jgi:hypothetical protein
MDKIDAPAGSRSPSPSRSHFADLPLLAQIAVALTFLNSWVLFEEVVVDRTGLWALLPGYVRGRFCPWDVAATGVVLLPLVLAAARRRRRVASSV